MTGFGRLSTAALGLFFLAFGAVRLAGMAEEVQARLAWVPVEARILEVQRGMAQGRGGTPFLLRLEVPQDAAPPRRPPGPFRLVVSGAGLPGGPPAPAPGDLIAALRHPAEPERILLRGQLTPLWFAAMLLLCLASGGALLYVAVTPSGRPGGGAAPPP